jgi:histidine decarboxylase
LKSRGAGHMNQVIDPIYTKPLSKRKKNQLDNLLKKFSVAMSTMGGYPNNSVFDYSELYPFLKYSVNNIGDPFVGSSYQANTHDLEREVLDFFANLFHLKENYRGYITNGSTEGNLYGINLGFRKYPDGIFFYSSAAHYSIKKIAELLRLEHEVIPVQKNGEIEYSVLEKLVKMYQSRPMIINLTVGTTMTEAHDNVERVINLFEKFNISKYHIHVDAALSGLILPFVKEPSKFDFASNIHSLVVSGHKFLGAPMPCGIALTRQTTRDIFVEYAQLNDSTISGSRNGTTALFLWYAINRLGKSGLKKRVQQCLRNTQYALKIFNQVNIPAWVNPDATTVVFPRPSENITKKWQLLVENDLAHIVIKVSTGKEFIHALVADLKK